MQTDFLKNYISNQKLVALIEKLIGQEEVYVIKNEFYRDTDFRERVFVDEKYVKDKSRYDIVNVAVNFDSLPCRATGNVTIAEHSQQVLEQTDKLLKEMPHLYASVATEDFDTLYAKDKIVEEFRNICLAGAYLHDIGKALIGTVNVQIDSHSYVGGNYLYRFAQEIKEIYAGEAWAEIMYEKLDNIIRWHMGYVLDKQTHSFVAERRPDTVKFVETYVVSLADWMVNTPKGSRRRIIDDDFAQFKNEIDNNNYKVATEDGYTMVYNEHRRLAIR